MTSADVMTIDRSWPGPGGPPSRCCSRSRTYVRPSYVRPSAVRALSSSLHNWSQQFCQWPRLVTLDGSNSSSSLIGMCTSLKLYTRFTVCLEEVRHRQLIRVRKTVINGTWDLRRARARKKEKRWKTASHDDWVGAIRCRRLGRELSSVHLTPRPTGHQIPGEQHCQFLARKLQLICANYLSQQLSSKLSSISDLSLNCFSKFNILQLRDFYCV